MHVAGAEVLVAETVRRLQGQVVPTVLCLDRIGPLGERLRGEGVEVFCLDRRSGRDWRLAWRMARILRDRGVEVIHAHQYTPFFYAALARVLLRGGPRLILTEHGRHYPDTVSSVRRSFNRLVLSRLASAVNACCAFSAEALSHVDGFAPGRVEVIDNGIESSRYQPADDKAALRQRLGLDPNRRYVVCVARFHPVKDHATLLNAFARVAASQPDVDLLLIGDGELRAELQSLSKSLGLSNRILFFGVRQDVPELLRAADVFALNSVSEAASLTLMEAMATGLPVVVTAVGGNPEIVRDGTDGLLVPRGDSGATAEALLRLLGDPERSAAMGAAGRSRVLKRYELSSTVESYHRLYHRLARRGRKPD
jgi:glycosyltransferase involved in cell wall biosynthesis